MAKYIPERSYGENNYKPFGKGPVDLCGSCRAYYKMLYKKQLIKTPFPPNCNGHVVEAIQKLRKEDFGNEEEFEDTKITLDPVSWAALEINWDLRWYQADVLSCLPASEKVFMSDGAIKSIAEVRVGDRVVTYDHKGTRTFNGVVSRTYNQGIKDVYRIVLDNGDELRCTSDHRVLAHTRCGERNPMFDCGSLMNSYKSILDGLTVGDRVYTINKFNRFGPVEDTNLARFLGYVGSDGYISKVGKNRNVYKLEFANIRKAIIDDYIRVFTALFPEDKIRIKFIPAHEYNGSWRQDTWKCLTYGKESKSIQFLYSIGADGKETRESSIAKFAFKLSENALASFLNSLYAGDGCIHIKNGQKRGVAISLLSGSKEVLKDYKLLLKKVGIQCSFIYDKTDYSDSGSGCNLSITSINDVERFLSFVGLVVGKEDDCKKALELASIIEGKNRRRFGTTTRAKIVAIEYIGPEQVYDIEVPGRNNFLANGIVVHNCTSQFKVLRQGRRCLAKGTMIATPAGPVAIETLKPGDNVYSEHGAIIKVKELFDQGIQDVIDIISTDDEVLATCTKDHRWSSLTYIVATDKLEGYIDTKVIGREYNGYSILYVKGLQNPRKEQCYDIHVDSPTNLYLLANGLVTHNSGKSNTLMVDALHFIWTNPGKRVLILAPYEAQVDKLFEELEMLVNRSNSLKNSLTRIVKKPNRLEFSNRSVIFGLSAGSKNSANRSDKVRGQDANYIIIDEIDYIPDEDLVAINAILASHADCKLSVCCTPSGHPGRFFSYVIDKNLKFKEFHIIAQESPEWSPIVEDFLARDYGGKSTPAWDHEILAEFGKQEHGVFVNDKIDASIKNYDMSLETYSPENKYIMGVDWNKIAGTHIVIVEKVGPTFRLVKKYIIPNSEFVQIEAVETIITLYYNWRPDLVVMDVGYGSTQIELLKKHAMSNPKSGLARRLKGIAMQDHIEIRDPSNGLIRRTPTKPFLVNSLKNVLDEGNLILPASEDTIETRRNAVHGVVQQMRNFKIEGHSVYGMPKYSQGNDHTITALMLAVSGYILEHSDLQRVNYSTNVSIEPITDNRVASSSKELENNIKDPTIVASRALDRGKPLLGYNTRDNSSISQHRKRREISDRDITRSKQGNHTNRKTF